MSRLPKMNLWIDAFNSDTSFLTEEELGVYMRMIFYAWSREAYLPHDFDFICMLTKKVDKSVIKKVLDMYWTRDERGYYQKRLKEEYDLAQSIISRNTINGQKGGRPKNNPNETQIKPSTSTSTSISISNYKNINELVDEDELNEKNTYFEHFWGNINNKISKGKARSNYFSLTIDWAKRFKELADKYNKYCAETDKKYTMLPSTWLFNENYLDEKKVEEVVDNKEFIKKQHADMYAKGMRLMSWSKGYMEELEKIVNANN